MLTAMPVMTNTASSWVNTDRVSLWIRCIAIVRALHRPDAFRVLRIIAGFAARPVPGEVHGPVECMAYLQIRNQLVQSPVLIDAKECVIHDLSSLRVFIHRQGAGNQMLFHDYGNGRKCIAIFFNNLFRGVTICIKLLPEMISFRIQPNTYRNWSMRATICAVISICIGSVYP
jgi:hypothetical protein